jgi:hypothetical protein
MIPSDQEVQFGCVAANHRNIDPISTNLGIQDCSVERYLLWWAVIVLITGTVPEVEDIACCSHNLVSFDQRTQGNGRAIDD